MPDMKTRTPRESQDKFVTLACPNCGVGTKGMKDNPPKLPEECDTCNRRQMEQQVDDLDTGQPQGTTQREILTLQSNVARMQSEQRKISAELTAMRGDMADMRRAIKEITSGSVSFGFQDSEVTVDTRKQRAKGRKAKG